VNFVKKIDKDIAKVKVTLINTAVNVTKVEVKDAVTQNVVGELIMHLLFANFL